MNAERVIRVDDAVVLRSPDGPAVGDLGHDGHRGRGQEAQQRRVVVWRLHRDRLPERRNQRAPK